MIGVDIVLISRIEKLYKKYGNKFLKKYLSEDEISLVKSSSTASGFWAVKKLFQKQLKLEYLQNYNFQILLFIKMKKMLHLLNLHNI